MKAEDPRVERARIDSPSQWLRLLLGLAAVFGLFQWSAVALGSDLGQAGLIVGALVVAATLVVERVLFGQGLKPAALAVGFGRPRTTGLAVAVAICAALWLVAFVFIRATGSSAAFRPGALALVPGLFAQAGVAEEVLFRGYLFGRVRRGRSFWRAASLSMLPFVAVHLLLFATMPWPIALAALILAVVLSFPLAHLFELAGSTMWAPALLHFVIQGTSRWSCCPVTRQRCSRTCGWRRARSCRCSPCWCHAPPARPEGRAYE